MFDCNPCQPANQLEWPEGHFLFLPAMIEKKSGNHFRIVLNGESLLDYRQSKVEQLYLYTGTIIHQVLNSLWAPIDGRALNLSIRDKR